MMTAHPGYSAAHALRTGGPAAARQALVAARAGTLAQFAAWSQALGPQLVVPYREGLNPLLWELGHLAWFQEYWVSRNRQRARGTSCQPEHARAPSLLPDADAWYDSSRVAHRSRWTLPLPDPQATLEYLADTLDVTLALLDRLPPDAGNDALYFFRLVALHEHMHGEAGAYMARSLGIPVPHVSAASQAAAGPRRSVRIPAQTFRTGVDGPGFAFDNEQGAHEVSLEAFEIDSRPVSSAEFMGFAEAGGYQARRWWSEPGWAWLQQQPGPLAGDAAGVGPHAPALHLSAHEAEAWCRWAGRRLPSEAEWECAALTATGFAWGAAWEWTASPFTPYPGFVAHPYRDYSQPWFHSRRVLRGACGATSEWLAHPRYRNFFEPGRRDIFAGFRSCA
jgi:ergothioneine biosynthesis protein EgtB